MEGGKRREVRVGVGVTRYYIDPLGAYAERPVWSVERLEMDLLIHHRPRVKLDTSLLAYVGFCVCFCLCVFVCVRV